MLMPPLSFFSQTSQGFSNSFVEFMFNRSLFLLSCIGIAFYWHFKTLSSLIVFIVLQLGFEVFGDFFFFEMVFFFKLSLNNSKLALVFFSIRELSRNSRYGNPRTHPVI